MILEIAHMEKMVGSYIGVMWVPAKKDELQVGVIIRFSGEGYTSDLLKVTSISPLMTEPFTYLQLMDILFNAQ